MGRFGRTIHPPTHVSCRSTFESRGAERPLDTVRRNGGTVSKKTCLEQVTVPRTAAPWRPVFLRPPCWLLVGTSVERPRVVFWCRKVGSVGAPKCSSTCWSTCSGAQQVKIGRRVGWLGFRAPGAPVPCYAVQICRRWNSERTWRYWVRCFGIGDEQWRFSLRLEKLVLLNFCDSFVIVSYFHCWTQLILHYRTDGFHNFLIVAVTGNLHRRRRH